MGFPLKTWISFLVLILAALNAFAEFQPTSRENCTSVDLRTGPLSKENIRDQDGMGSCYAFAATSVAEYMYWDQIKPKRLSALGTSILYSAFEGSYGKPGEKAISYGGWPEKALSILQNSEICTEDELPSEDKKNRLAYKTIYNQLLDLYRLWDEWQRILEPMLDNVELGFLDRARSILSPSYGRKVKLEKIKNQVMSRFQSFISQQCNDRIQNLQRVILKDFQVEDIFQILNQAMLKEMYQEFILRRCKNRVKLNRKFSVKTSYRRAMDRFRDRSILSNPLGIWDNPFKDMHEQLNTKRPLVISMAINPILNERSKVKDVQDQSHAMVVVGRQWNPGSGCMLIIRNSWGNSCGAFDLTKVKCEGGDLIIPESIIYDTVERLAWLE